MTYDLDPEPRSGHLRVSEDVWLNMRHDFAGGLSARDVATRYEVPLSTVRDRQRREGWRRGDLPKDYAASWTDDDEADLSVDPIDMADTAWRHAARAIARGDRNGARAWIRIATDLRRTARESIEEAQAQLAQELDFAAFCLDEEEPDYIEADLRVDPVSEEIKLNGADVVACRIIEDRDRLRAAAARLRPRLSVELLSTTSPNPYLFSDEAAPAEVPPTCGRVVPKGPGGEVAGHDGG